MLHWIVSFALTGGAGCIEEGLPAAPIYLSRGQQIVELRKPLVARADGARLVLFVRAQSTAREDKKDLRAEFRSAAPPGSVSAVLTTSDGQQMTLAHTGYTFYRGYRGLLLSGLPGEVISLPKMYSRLALDSKVAFSDVRVVWLDRDAVDVRDVHPRL